MTTKKHTLRKGLVIKGDTDALEGIEGEIKFDSADKKFKITANATAREIVDNSTAQTLTNKSIDADSNPISNIETDNLKAGVLNTSSSLSGASNTQVPSALAAKDYADSVGSTADTNLNNHINDTADAHDASAISNVPAGTIAATDVQAAINELDGDIQGHITDSVDAHDASAISITSIPTITATDVQGALAELQSDVSTVSSDLNAHIVDTADAHDASAISNIPAGNIAATDVQAAINELDGDIQGHITDTVDAHDASAISVVPTGNLAADDVQEALVELQGEADIANAHIAASTNVHGLSGGAAVVGTTSSQTLTNKTITGADFRTPIRLDVKQDTVANLTTYASTAASGQLAFGTDTKAYYGITDSSLVSLGGSEGGGLDVFYTENMEGLANTSTFATGNNATFLGGGTLQGTLALESSAPISGTKSLRYTQAAGSLNDYFASPVINLDIKERDNTSGLTLYFEYDGNDNDMRFVVWDVTNSREIASELAFVKTATKATRYSLSFYAPANCTQVRWGAQVEVANSGKILLVDDVEMSTNPFVSSETSNDTDWEDAGLVAADFAGFGIPTNIQIQTRRDGSDLLIRGKFTAGTSTGAEARMNLKHKGSYLTSEDTTKIPTIQLAGDGTYSVATANQPKVLIEPSVGYITFSQQQAASAGLTKAAGSGVLASSTTMSIYARVPIRGWANSTTTSILTPSDTVSSDTIPFRYRTAAQVSGLTGLADAQIGDYITFTYAANTNTRTQTSTRPTQTDADMNVNGIRIWGRGYNQSSGAATDITTFAIQIGKGLKGISLALYKSTGKTIAGDLDYSFASSATDKGMRVKAYNENTGIMYVDCGLKEQSTNTAGVLTFSDLTDQTNGYLVINASKSPALVGVPQVLPRIATLSDVKAANTGGGAVTGGSFFTRTLNTLDDPTGVVSSLSSNQFTLPSGTYYLRATIPAFGIGNHKAKLRNITDSVDTIIGHSQFASGVDNVVNESHLVGQFTITATKVFEIQHRTSGTSASTSSLGVPANFGISEVYTIAELTKVK